MSVIISVYLLEPFVIVDTGMFVPISPDSFLFFMINVFTYRSDYELSKIKMTQPCFNM